MSSRPLFIAVEGLDGAGTTTQSRLLADWLVERGRRVHLTREPSDGPIGQLIRQRLRQDAESFDAGALALLFAADRLDHLAREVRPALAAGLDVITDRYALSSLAYQARNPDDLDWVRTLNERADATDLMIVLDVPLDVCLERLGQRGGHRDQYEQRSVLATVDAAYRRILASMTGTEGLHVIDGTAPVREVAALLIRIVRAHLGTAPS